MLLLIVNFLHKDLQMIPCTVIGSFDSCTIVVYFEDKISPEFNCNKIVKIIGSD